MTFRESAAALRRCADALDRVLLTNKDCETGAPKPMLTEETAVGGAAILCYIRDLFTSGEREQFDRGSILVVLETISRDAELFPCGIGTVMWQAEDKDEAAQ